MAIVKAKGRNPITIKPLIDYSKITIGDDGTVTGIQEQIDKLVKAEDSKFLFEDKYPKFKGAVPAPGRNVSIDDAFNLRKTMGLD